MAQNTADRSFANYLSIGEAAEILGVSPWTLRNWDGAGKLKPTRHPVSGYRMYRREDLHALLEGDGVARQRRRSQAAAIEWSELGDTEHFVQFYETERYLVDSVSEYVEQALAAGDGTLIIATKEHRNQIQRKLKRRGIDLAAARRSGQYVALDAAELLATFMIDDAPDAGRFEETVGGVVREMAHGHTRVRAFGEMVALLWADGKREAACQVESLWNELAEQLSFTLYCAYPLNGFLDEASGESLADVCGCHTRVIPAESYSTLSTPDEQLRLIASLQQKAQRLEAEIAQRRAAERELSDFIENALEGLHKVGPDGIILWANKAELEMLGYEPDEYIGHHIGEFYADPQAVEGVLNRLLSGENVYNERAVLRAKNGELKYALVHSNACFVNGQFAYTRCYTRDVTEIRQADRDRAALAAIIESSQDAIFSKTFDGVIRSWNTSAERIFGYTAGEAIGQPNSLIVPPDKLEEEEDMIARLRRGEPIEHYETVRVAKDGRRIDVSLTTSPWRDTEGHIVGAAKIARDVTERKQVAERLRESEERFRRLVELLPVGVYTCEAPSGTITFYNEQAAKLWGRAPAPGDSNERFCGSFKLFHPDGAHLPHQHCPMAAALQQGESFRNQEVEIERPDGTRITALVNIDPIRDGRGNVVAAINVFSDITPLKQAKQQLIEADRRKDEFLATLAHELRNPLAPIRNGLQILRMSGHGDAAAIRVQEMMDRQVAHMVRLIDDLLELSRISRGQLELKRERADLRAIVNHALETSKPFIESGEHKLELALPEDSLVVEGDQIRLSQVLGNLINNAAKYSDKGGRIVLAVRREGAEAVISVRDSGIGIPADMLSRVFDMFTQVKNPLCRSQDGLGIGLSLVHTLVQMHGGSVEALSDGIGLGSEFIVRLPLSEAGSRSFGSHGRPPVEGGAPMTVRRILCVDDNRDAATSLGMLLKYLGADVQTVFDGASALEAIKLFRPSIVLMDLGMPDIDGCEVARRIRQDSDHENMLLIAMTGWGQEEDRRRSREAGFDQHLVKPIDIGALQAILSSTATVR